MKKREAEVKEVVESQADKNVQAFLKTIRYAEGTSGPKGYATTYAYKHYIQNFSDHPYYTGEWKGEVLPDKYCIGAGLTAGCKSTAAGAYGMIRGTWKAVKDKLSLPDFSPNSQDLGAIELIRQYKALEDVKAGRITDATYKLAKVWASLPGFDEGQPDKTIGQIKQEFTNQGGVLA